MRYFKLHDVDKSGAIEINLKDAHQAQSQGYGIFHLVNEFQGARKLENLKKINFWYCELDNKKNFADLLDSMPVHPTIVNETKKGYHIYFKARDASINRYKLIQKRIQHFFGGDMQAMDAARLLRAPGFLHLKDVNNPFMVKTIWCADVDYREAVMLQALPQHPDEFEELAIKENVKQNAFSGDKFLDWLWQQDQGQLLQQISGTDMVSYEQIEVRRNVIFVNGKPTGCWIDKSGRIGSASNGGPGVLNWVMWYGHNFKETIDFLRMVFGGDKVN